jgi:AcrR family transcriptional regulator
MFAERGLKATTVADICDAVDVSQRTFFRYFAAKEDVLLSDLTDLLAAAAAGVAERPAGEAPLDAIFASLAAAARQRSSEPIPLLLAANSSELPLLKVWERALSEGLLRRAGLEPASASDDALLRCDLAAGVAGVAVRRTFQAFQRVPGNRQAKGAYMNLLAEAFRLIAAGCPGPW